jgi:hypothetical protein
LCFTARDVSIIQYSSESVTYVNKTPIAYEIGLYFIENPISQIIGLKSALKDTTKEGVESQPGSRQLHVHSPNNGRSEGCIAFASDTMAGLRCLGLEL